MPKKFKKRTANQKRIRIQAGFLFLLFFLMNLAGLVFAREIVLSEQEAVDIGNKVFSNECSSRDDRLIQWNKGEDFLSCGIGHFIWYHKEYQGPFEESFPEFLDYACALDVSIPKWLYSSPTLSCPWVSRDNFLNNQDDIRIKELREFLIATKPLQAEFIVKRLKNALLLMLEGATSQDKTIIQNQFERIASTSSGVYALADYINFKGLGILPSERYLGKGWGLSQVLLEMRNESEVPDALEEFVRAANNILGKRVKNALPGRNEERWLFGWQNRVNSYLNE